MKLLSFVRVINRCCTFKQLNVISVRKSRTLAGDRLIELKDHTLTGRIMSHLNIDTTSDKKVKQNTIDTINKLKSNNFEGNSSFTIHQLKAMLLVANNKSYVDNKEQFQKLIHLLDSECSQRIKDLSLKAVFDLLNVYMQVVPNRITQYTFYNLAVEHLISYLQFLQKEDLLKLIFYIGLEKRSKQAQVNLRKCMRRLSYDDIKNMSTEDLCIICNSTFKTSTKIANKDILDKVVSTLNDNMHLLSDPALLITLIKTIRHNRFQDEDVLSTISCGILFNKTCQYYSFVAICHILALFADYLYYEENLLNIFVDSCINKIKTTQFETKGVYEKDQIRGKDIRRFLWALSNLGYELDSDVIDNVIVPNIAKRISLGEYKDDVDVLMDTILYLWVLNYQAVDLVKYVVTEENVGHIRAMPTKSKARLNVLLTVMQFENPQLYRSLNVKPFGAYFFDQDLQIRNRPALQRVFQVLQEIGEDNEGKSNKIAVKKGTKKTDTKKNEGDKIEKNKNEGKRDVKKAEMKKIEMSKLDVNKFSYTCEVPYLNVVGITGFKKNVYKAIFFEVLDSYVCVKNKESWATGPMQMKLRILEKQDEALVQIHEDDIEDMTDEELYQYLENEIKLLC